MIFDHFKFSFVFDELIGEIDHVVRARREFTLMDDFSCADANGAFAPMEKIAPFEAAGELRGE